MICKNCNDDTRMHRRKRHGLLQNRIFPLFGMYPWKCESCGDLRLYRARGEKSHPSKHKDSTGLERA